MTDENSPEQLVLDVKVAKTVDGIEMGVFSNGSTYLSGRSLAKLCGVAPSAIIYQRKQWDEGNRDGDLAKYLLDRGVETLYRPIVNSDGRSIHAFPDSVCTVFLTYYALYHHSPSPTAKESLDRLAQAGLRTFIHQAVGYSPSGPVPPQMPAEWEDFAARLTMHDTPDGYFSIFREASDFLLMSIKQGLPHNASTVPDISIGIAWSKHWKDSGLEKKYGQAIRYEHNYPENYPQAASNPQSPLAYPEAALGEYRSWMRDVYYREKFGKYLKGQVRKGALGENSASALLSEAQKGSPKALPLGKDEK